MTINNQGQTVEPEQVNQRIKELNEEYFLNGEDLTLRNFIRIAKEDKQMTAAFEEIGVFKKGKYAGNFFEGLEEELNRAKECHSGINDEKYKRIREGVDFNPSDAKNSGDLFDEDEVETGDQFMAVKPYVGAVKNSAPSNSIDFRPNLDPPEMDIQLKYVHGYRAFDTRNNIHFCDDSHIIFHAAGVNIKMNIKKQQSSRKEGNNYKQEFNIENSDDITAMAFNAKTKLAAYGQVGAKPLINIVNTVTMETELIIANDLKKGIAHLAFNHDGTMLAASAMNDDHDIALYDISKLTQKSKISSKSPGYSLICKSRGTKDVILGLKFAKNTSSPTLYLVTRRDVHYATLSKNKLALKKVSGYPKNKKFTNICIGFLSGFDLVVGTGSGELQGIKGNSYCQSVKEHSKIVYATWSSSDGKILITGSADGKVIIWGAGLKKLEEFVLNDNFELVDPRIRALALSPTQKYLVVGTRGGQIVRMEFGKSSSSKHVNKEIILNSHYSDELWGLACHSTKSEFVTCGEDFLLSKWCLKEKKMLSSKILKYQAKVVAINEKANKIAVGCTNGRVLILNYLNLELIKDFKVSNKEISEMKFSPGCSSLHQSSQDELLAVGAHDGKIYVFNNHFKRIGVLKGHHSTITHIDFGLSGDCLQSNCTSYELLYFDLNSLKQNTRGASQYKDDQWATWTCTFGWWVQGIYPPCSDGTDVNSVDRSHDSRFLITGDDFGTVKIFNNPGMKKSAYKKYLGHSSHVTNVRFSANDQYIVSVGGHDKSIFIWENLSYDPRNKEKNLHVGASLKNLESQQELNDLDDEFENDPEMVSVFRNFEKSNNDDSPTNDADDEGNDLYMEEEEEAGDQFMAVKPFLGQVKHSQPSDFYYEKGMESVPDENLELYYANGYRCFDARNTAKFSSDANSIVFVTAALGVTMDIRENSQTFFNQHEEDIISFDVNQTRNLAVSGQMAAKGKTKMIDIFVWDINTKQVLANLKGFHLRAIKIVKFSSSGKYLLTFGLDDDHSLAVYDWSQERLICSSKVDKKNVMDSAFLLNNDKQFLSVGSRHCKTWTFNGCNIRSSRVTWPKRLKLEGSSTYLEQEPLITCASFSENSYVIGTFKGKMIQIVGGSMAKAWQVHEGPLSVFNNSVSAKRLFTGGRDGKIVEFIYEKNALKMKRVIMEVLPNDSFSVGIKSIDSLNKKLLVGTSGSDLFVVDDFDNKSSVKNKKHVLTGHFRGELWGLAVHPSEQFFVSVGDDAVARLFDVFERKCLKSVKLPEKCRAVAISHSGSKVVFAGYEGNLYLYNSTLEKFYQKVDTKLNKPHQWIQDIKFSPNDQYVAFGHHGGLSKVIVYELKNSKLSFYAKINAGLTSALLHLDWSKDSSSLVINSQAYELKFLNVMAQNEIRASGAKDIEWHSWTCKLGFPVQGIFPGVDGSDVNTVCRSYSEKLMVTGDDFQLIKLFKYPSVVKKSQFKSYLGHSSHVTNARFILNDNFLVSVGGNDKTSIIWKTDFGGELKKTLKKKSGAILQNDNNNWEDEFVTKKVIKHKYAEDFAKQGYNVTQNDTMETEEGEDKENVGMFEEEEVDCGDEFMAVKPWLGAIKSPSDYLGFNASNLNQPEIDVEIDYVFGYRTKDCRNNLFLNMNHSDTAELMYYSAGLGIGLNIDENTQRFLKGHHDDVISMDYHPSANLIATGELGPKPTIMIHNADTFETICELKQGVVKGVSTLSFSPSGNRLAAVCINDDHSIGIFEKSGSSKNSQWNLMKINKGDRNIITCLQWINENEFISFGKRHAKSWRISGGNFKASSTTFGKACDYIVSAKRMEGKSNAQILAGAINGELQVWGAGNIKNTMKNHTMAIDAIFTGENDMNVFMTGGRDCLINFYNKGNFNHIGFINLNQLITDTSISNRVRAIQMEPDGSSIYIGTYSSEIWRLSNLNLSSALQSSTEMKGSSDPSSFGFSKFNFMKKKNSKEPSNKNINILQFIDTDTVAKSQVMAAHFSPNLKWTNEVWGLDVIDEERYVSVSDDSTLRIWNSQSRKCELTVQLDLDAKNNHLPKCAKTGDLQDSCKLRSVSISHNKQWAAIGCKDGSVRMVDLSSGKQVKFFKCRKSWVQCIRFSPDDSLLAVGSHDSKITVFAVIPSETSSHSIPKLRKISSLTKHRAFLTHLDFSKCGRYIHSNCGGYELLFFDAITGEQMTSGATMLRDEEWATWSCILGWPVQGIFQPEWDGSDVNMVDRSHLQHNGDMLLAAADDYSTVRVYKYPCLKNSAKAVILRGHSSHVTNVKWSPQDKMIFSAGGEDQSIIQWRVTDK